MVVDKRIRSLAVGMCCVFALAPLCFGQGGDPAAQPFTPTPAIDAEAMLNQLLDEDLDESRRYDPIQASIRGDRRFDRLLPDVSAQGRADQLRAWTARFHKLEQLVDPEKLSEASRVNRALLAYEIEQRLAFYKFRTWEMAVTQLSGPHIELCQMPDQIAFTTDRHLDDYIARLQAVPEYLRQVTSNLRDGLGSGRTPPKIVVGSAAEQVLSQAGPEFEQDPTRHPMYAPFLGRDDDLSRRAAEAIRTAVVPAFRAFGEFLRDEYVPGCRETIACSDLPRGAIFYELLLYRHSTMFHSAQEIHSIGMVEVARIKQEMMNVIARSDFPKKNELQGDELFRAFVEYLRTDPRFYYTDPDELLRGYRDIAKRIDAELPRFFTRLPRLTYGVREMPRFIAPSNTTAYYYPGSLRNGVPGYFVANTYALDQRPKYEMIALTMHEAVPGHHLQIALAQELFDDPTLSTRLHEWRTERGYTAFVEGWALYAERLGLEMGTPPYGIYADPYDDFGRLSYEQWRAMRLVVDTGIHALGWSRDQAIQFMLENSALSRTNIEREVDRYIAWPGQAVGYKLGEMRIRQLRERCEAELGSAFDIRAFHDELLSQGALPLDILDDHMMRWVQRTKPQNAPASAPAAQ